MSNEENPGWSAADSYPNLGAMPEDDFSNFLDLENIDFTFPSLDGTAYNAPAPVSAENRKFASYGHSTNGTTTSHLTPGFEQDHVTMPMATEASQHSGYSAYHHQDAQYQWPSNQHYPHVSVPPTPNSSELYPTSYNHSTGSGPHYMQSHHPYEHKDDSFTPRTSPHFVANATSVHDYAIGDAHILSPLTSPAMYPQQEVIRAPSSVHSHTAESSITGSPVDLEHDFVGDLALEERPRKTRRKEPAVKSTKPSPAGTRKRKGSITTRSESKAIGKANVPGDHARRVQDRASNPASVSPQPQLEYTMRPPPPPLSAKSTPSIDPRSASSNQAGFPPATPASLMRLAKQQQTGLVDDHSPSQLHLASPRTDALGLGMEELTLPEAAATTSDTSSTAATPRLSSQHPSRVLTTPALLPRISSTGSTAVATPTSAPYGNTSKNPAGRGGTRKRNGGSSTLVSPALRPRISPNIKPLLVDNGRNSSTNMTNDETHALLLASKSNYQNLLEGNHLPGVNYPSELSTNLTSKRTSHKIAEQGRRNRINTALQEMQSLLPSSPAMIGTSPANGEEGLSRSGSGSGSGTGETKTPATPMQAANSKAATVELAIEYIKTLNGKLSDKEMEVERLRSEMGALKQRLGTDVIAESVPL